MPKPPKPPNPQKIDKQTIRMLASQVAIASPTIDDMPNIYRAAKRALRGALKGDVSRLDADALEALENAQGNIVRTRNDDYSEDVDGTDSGEVAA